MCVESVYGVCACREHELDDDPIYDVPNLPNQDDAMEEIYGSLMSDHKPAKKVLPQSFSPRRLLGGFGDRNNVDSFGKYTDLKLWAGGNVCVKCHPTKEGLCAGL